VTKEYQTDGKNSADAAFKAVNEVFLKDLLGSKGITVNSVLFSDGNLFIDFPKKIYELNLGSAGESSFLESIADTYLNNVEGIKAVYYTVDKEAYASENIELLKDTPYKKK
ncbi:MAG: GerMN domain-containing protein, partial [Christensenellaceae bacterium]